MHNHDKNNSNYIHKYLNKMYFRMMYGENKADKLNFSELYNFKKIEEHWINNEISNCQKWYDCGLPIYNSESVEAELIKHPVFSHPIYDYLRDYADINDLKTFVLNDSILNVEFFDYIALALFGTTGQAKAEISANLWDEAGRGEEGKFHTNLFMNLMTDLGLKYDRENIINLHSWQGLAGINLFSYLSLYPFNKMKYFGLLAATEMLDPSHYHKLLIGINRILKEKKVDYSYYNEHELIDVEHASGWLNKVIIPELEKSPHKLNDFWVGFYLRLDSTKRYYDELLDQFRMKIAA